MSDQYWSQNLSRLAPYVPGEQPKQQNLIKLNTNENPYGPSPRVIEALTQGVGDVLRRYPDPDSSALRQCIAHYYNAHAPGAKALSEENVFVGNGSDEVLAHAFQAFFKQSLPIVFSDITYGFYPVYCKLYEIDAWIQPLTSSFTIDLSCYPQVNGGVVLANPNATTGHALSLETIESFLKLNTDSVVLVDEAYVDFGAETAVSLISKYPQLLVVQTLSKSRSLAGMRVGFALGSDQLISALVRVKDSFNSYPLDRLAQVAAIASFEDEAYFRHSVSKIVTIRASLVEALSLRGFEVIPSAANFILARHPDIQGAQLYNYLRNHNVLVRYFDKPRLNEYLRITIGKSEECQTLVDVIDTFSTNVN